MDPPSVSFWSRTPSKLLATRVCSVTDRRRRHVWRLVVIVFRIRRHTPSSPRRLVSHRCEAVTAQAGPVQEIERIVVDAGIAAGGGRRGFPYRSIGVHPEAGHLFVGRL